MNLSLIDDASALFNDLMDRPSHVRIRVCCGVFALLIFHGSLAGYAQEQEKERSPVFKSSRPPKPTATFQPSDIAYQLWRLFDLTQKANGGDPLAQYELGVRYLMGKGVQADTVRGAYWTTRAAGQNLVTARYNLAILQYNGWGVDWNPFASYRNFLEAARNDIVEAQYVMGQFLTDNLVVARNIAEARRWVKKAADAGYRPAREALAEFEKHQGKQVQDDEESGHTEADSLPRNVVAAAGLSLVFLDFEADTARAIDDLTLLKDALRTENPEVMRALGLAKLRGDSLDVDAVTIPAIEQAAEAGSPEALTILGRCYEKGLGVGADAVRACVAYVRAIRLGSARSPELLWRLVQKEGFADDLAARASDGDPEAQYAWACLVALALDPSPPGSGRLTEAQALRMLQRSADHGYVQAIIELGLCSFSGRWVPEDRVKAEELWTRAAEMGMKEARVRLATAHVQRLHEPYKAVDELRQSALEGSLLAQVALGYCFERGIGVGVNSAEAARLYRLGAQRGSQDAYRALRRMHDVIRPAENEFGIPE